MIETINPEALNSMDADSLVKHYDDLNNAWHKWMETGDLPSGMDLSSLAKIYWQVVDALKQKGYDLVAPPESDAELVPPKGIQTNENVEQSMNVAATQKYAPFYESEIQEAGEHPLRVPDPDFVMSRLRQGKESLILSKEDQSPLDKRVFILMNEYPAEDVPVKGYGRVSFEQQKGLIQAVSELGDRVDSVDPFTRQEFERMKGPFYVLSLSLNDDFGEPKEYPKPPQGRPTRGLAVMPIAEALSEGGSGSGDFGHAGRPGEIGGSGEGGAGKSGDGGGSDGEDGEGGKGSGSFSSKTANQTVAIEHRKFENGLERDGFRKLNRAPKPGTPLDVYPPLENGMAYVRSETSEYGSSYYHIYSVEDGYPEYEKTIRFANHPQPSGGGYNKEKGERHGEADMSVHPIHDDSGNFKMTHTASDAILFAKQRESYNAHERFVREALWLDGTYMEESGIDAKELAMGIKHEMEHTDDPEIAKKYATDHLEKFSDYYTVLAKAEKMMKPADNQPRSELNNTEKQFEGGPGTEDGGQQVRDMNAFTTKGHAGVFQPHEAAGGDPLQSL